MSDGIVSSECKEYLETEPTPLTYGTMTRSMINLDSEDSRYCGGGRGGGSQLRLARKVSKYLKEKYFPLYNVMFVISGHPHIRQLTVWTDPPPLFCD